jgi:endo-alpha-1,4-polygalactosaminidase (GH114 family)
MNRRWWIVAGAAVLALLAAALVWRGLRGEDADPPTASADAPPASATASPSPEPSLSARPSPSATPRRSSKPAPLPKPPGQRWKVAPGQPWQWQLTTPVDLSVDVPIYDIDGFDNSAEVVRKLHAAGRKVICYIEVGSAADFRPDYGSFPKSILGEPNGWPGERSVDIRRIELLAPILAKRFDMCKAKGFDAIEPDLMENYTADTGFPVTAAHQLAFNRFVSRLAHERGMAVALKNDPGQVDQLVGDFDFAVVEECAEFDECDRYLPFIRAGKAVLHVEYKLDRPDFCSEARANRFSSMRKALDLDAPRQPC